MNDDGLFRNLLVATMVVCVPIGLTFRLRSQATREPLARREEGLFILIALRLCGLVVWASPPQLRIVLQNLLGNAAKFTRRTLQPEVRLSGVRDAEGQLTITIADNGAGFGPEQARRLFQPFQRLHRHDEFDGTGIGLTIVQRIVQRHGGSISARGEPGVGATFEFTLGQRESSRPEPITVPDRLPQVML